MVSFHHTQAGVEGHFDPESHILRISYSGNVTPENTGGIYAWGWQLSEMVGVKNICGMITDFRMVVTFAPQSLGTALRESRRINKAYDLRQLPVAHIVKNMYQEQMVTISTELSGNPDRMKIVYSEDEALAFIESWHLSHSAGMCG